MRCWRKLPSLRSFVGGTARGVPFSRCWGTIGVFGLAQLAEPRPACCRRRAKTCRCSRPPTRAEAPAARGIATVRHQTECCRGAAGHGQGVAHAAGASSSARRSGTQLAAQRLLPAAHPVHARPPRAFVLSSSSRRSWPLRQALLPCPRWRSSTPPPSELAAPSLEALARSAARMVYGWSGHQPRGHAWGRIPARGRERLHACWGSSCAGRFQPSGRLPAAARTASPRRA